MKSINKPSKRYRSLLIGGGVAIAITSVLIACYGSCTRTRTDTDDTGSTSEVTTVCTTTTTSTATTSTSTSSTTVESTTTTTTVLTTMNVNTTLAQIETQPYVVATQPVVVEQQPVETSGDLPITETERIMLCNLVGREYGSDWVSVYDKACVVATVMNRVYSASFPNTIYDVLVQPNQFTGYIPQDTYTYQVTDSCIEAVNYYFNHQGEFGNYLYFWGDGTRNYFS